jgi:hypothetical protein
MTVWAMVFARNKMWAWAVPFALMATVTRITGVLMFGVIGLEWLRFHGWTLQTVLRRSAWQNLWEGIRTDWLNLLMLFTIPLGLLSYMQFLNRQFNDPIAFLTAQSAWGRSVDAPYVTVYNELRAFFVDGLMRGQFGGAHQFFDVVAVIGVFASIFFIWRRLESGYGLYALLSMLIPVSGGTITAATRYTAIIFPLFMMLAVWGKHEWVDRLISVSFSVFMGLMMALFVNWIYVG